MYEGPHCIKSSQYIERFNVSSLSLSQDISMYQKISTLNMPPAVYGVEERRPLIILRRDVLPVANTSEVFDLYGGIKTAHTIRHNHITDTV